VLDWRAPVFRKRGAIGLHQWNQIADPADVDDEPGVADTRGPLYGNFGLGGDVERRAALAHGLHPDTGIVDRIEPALMGDAILGPQPAHQPDRLIEALRAFAQGNAKRVELRLAVTKADPEDVVPPVSTSKVAASSATC